MKTALASWAPSLKIIIIIIIITYLSSYLSFCGLANSSKSSIVFKWNVCDANPSMDSTVRRP